jgi:hypothetical protein
MKLFREGTLHLKILSSRVYNPLLGLAALSDL